MSKPSQAEAMGQVIPWYVAQIPILGVTYNIRRHPDVLRLKHIDEWIAHYEYNKRGDGVGVDFYDRNPCWVDLENEYEAIIKGLEYEQYNKKSS